MLKITKLSSKKDKYIFRRIYSSIMLRCKSSIRSPTLPCLFSFKIKEKEVEHMMNWSYDLIKIMYEEKLKELLLNETAQRN